MKGGEDLYLMGNAKEALHCVQDLESAHDELTPSLGVLAILNERGIYLTQVATISCGLLMRLQRGT